ncbi:MAG: ATP-dependent DNA helicase RecG [Deltaproteobacteria bacterium]|nr:ATP-dependent DNA helicase RecG [Deltaproteobacteria bacterium]
MNSVENEPRPTTTYEGTPLSPRECLHALQTPVRYIKGVGPMRAALLEGLGLKTVDDLLYHLPFRYEDRRELKKIHQATIGREDSFVGKLVALDKRYVPRIRRQILIGTLTDGTGTLSLVWFHPKPYITKRLHTDQDLLVHGKVDWGRGTEKKIVHPEFEPVEPGEEEEREKILPVYLKPGGIPTRMIRRWVNQALTTYWDFLPSFLPPVVAQRHHVTDLKRALIEIHQPNKEADIVFLNQFRSRAHRSIIFDEFFYLQLGLALRRKHHSALTGHSLIAHQEGLTRRMRALTPFSLTNAQERVLGEIYRDMASSHPMQRLMQGDVGSGKTIVAWFAALRAIENGFQAVLLAPTELLAEQHFSYLKAFADELNITTGLLIGSLPASEKENLLVRIGKGEIAFVVGTHALIQEGVQVPRLGLGIIDEQHRFGVFQRMALKRLSTGRNSTAPSQAESDILLISATPIPRSLAMILYGDMEVSYLDEMPPGRTPTKTRLFYERERSAVYEIVREEVHKGHQAYVVYPLVEESERLPLRDATGMAEEFSRVIFKDFCVGLLHGRMAADEREQVMRHFKKGELQILVATTVIEVGVDVPNATIIVVEHAERFGLSHLHQLRGRVGRGKDPSQCLLVQYATNSREAITRLRVMEQVKDGFKIAEADLSLRGPGELLGTRQSGLPDFRLASLARDSQLLLDARQEALDWLAKDPSLTQIKSRALREILNYRWGGKLELGSIG